MVEFNTIDELQIEILRKLFTEGDFVVVRELKTLELCNVNFCLSNPLNRNTHNSKRKWKYPLAIGEFAWHISGSNDLDFISYYARQWKNFSSDGRVINESCYGHKIFKKDALNESQWSRLITLLKRDRFSRRAVLDLFQSDNGIDYISIDVACVCTVQFLIRNGKLDAIVNMRSNDIIWGLPYDIYLFTMLQELLSLELGVALGKYYHNVGSMHIYEKHFNLGREMLSEQIDLSSPALKMDDVISLAKFIEYEDIIRTTPFFNLEIETLPISKYWKELLNQLLLYRQTKNKNQ